MAPKPKTSSSSKLAPAPPSSSSSSSSSPPSPPTFPPISPKDLKDLKVETLLEDQIIVVHDILTPQECKSFISFFDTLSMTPSPPAKRGEAQRSNGRYSTISPTFAQTLFTSTGLSTLVSSWPSVISPTRRTVQGLHPNIRVYSYTEGQLFANHYDVSSPSPLNPSHSSEWTLLIYLLPPPPAPQLQGGETIFHLPGKKGGEVVVVPKSGTALLHRHGSGRECLRHEGKEVRRGEKWVLRSDVLFG